MISYVGPHEVDVDIVLGKPWDSEYEVVSSWSCDKKKAIFSWLLSVASIQYLTAPEKQITSQSKTIRAQRPLSGKMIRPRLGPALRRPSVRRSISGKTWAGKVQ